jgi:hypothetical protein
MLSYNCGSTRRVYIDPNAGTGYAAAHAVFLGEFASSITSYDARSWLQYRAI